MVSAGRIPNVSTNAPVVASIALRSNAGETAKMPDGIEMVCGATEIAAQLETLPGAKMTLAAPSPDVAIPPLAVTTVVPVTPSGVTVLGGERVAVIVRRLVRITLGSSSTTW